MRNALGLRVVAEDARIRAGVAGRQLARSRWGGRRLSGRRLRGGWRFLGRRFRRWRLRGWFLRGLLRLCLRRTNEATRRHAEPDGQSESDEELIPIHAGSLLQSLVISPLPTAAR